MAIVVGKMKYKNINIVVDNGKKYICKELTENENRFLSKIKREEYILKPDKVIGSLAYLPFVEDGVIENGNKKFFIKAIEVIAEFHNFTNVNEYKFLPEINYEKDINELELISTDLNLLEIKNQIKKLFDKKYVCHGDFIALNVLKDGENIKIIDWENACIGFAEMDIGRLLGDLHYDNPSVNHRYYNFDWHDELVENYLEERKRLDGNFDMEKSRKLIILGELWNYLGPIEMGIRNKTQDSVWFKANLEVFRAFLPRF